MELPTRAALGKGERLLLVDDDPDGREAMQRRLIRRGYRVEAVDGAQAALATLEAGQFELMLLDHNMPGMTGLELLALLRMTRSEIDLPIVMLTAQADSQHLLKAFELGANDYVSKPVDFEVAMVRIAAQIGRRKAELALRESEERYSLAVRGANDGLWDWDLRSGTIYLSERWKAIIGYTDAEVGPDPSEWLGRIHPEDGARVREQIRSYLSGEAGDFESEHRLLHRDNAYRWVRARGLAVRPAPGMDPVRIAGSLADINGAKSTDPLTGLANRLCFEERLADLIERYTRDRQRPFAVLFIDLDHFKLINDSLGHQAGDELLKEVGKRLSAAIRPALVARLGGDEFAIVAEDVELPDDAVRIGLRLVRALGQPHQLEGREIFTSASIGIALCTPQPAGAALILRNADTALYKAKSNGRSRVEVFNESMKAEVVARMEMEADLRQAIGTAQLEAFYQPKVEIHTGRIEGFEALLRWHHPVKGLLSPLLFIPLAEETGMILEIGRRVLEQACAQLKRWQDAHPKQPGLQMAVNVSVKQMKDPELPGTVAQALRDNGIPPQSLCLEITEGALMDNTEATVCTLEQLKALGVRIQIDDFGTGYSSLAYLSRFPLDGLKIDRSFVEKILDPGNEVEIVRSIMALAEATGLEVVAEGIESIAQARALTKVGCKEGQGYYYSPPVPVAAIDSMLDDADRLPHANSSQLS